MFYGITVQIMGESYIMYASVRILMQSISYGNNLLGLQKNPLLPLFMK